MTLVHELINAPPAACNCVSCAPLLPRRKFLAGSVATIAVAGAANLLSARRAAAQTTLEPDEVLKALIEGNARFVAQELTSFDDDLHILKDNTIDKQEPFAAVLPAPIRACRSNWCSTRASAIFSSRGSPAIFARRKLSPASNMARAFWGPR